MPSPTVSLPDLINVGQNLVASVEPPSLTTTGCEWKAGGTTVQNDGTKTYTVATADAGKKITATISYDNDGATATATSNECYVRRIRVTVALPAIEAVEKTLTPEITAKDANDQTVTPTITRYVWEVGETDGQTTTYETVYDGNYPTYTIAKEDENKLVRVTIYYTDSPAGAQDPVTLSETSSVCEIAIDTSELRPSIHLRGGRGITVIPDGTCLHGQTGDEIAQVNWDGLAKYTYIPGGTGPDASPSKEEYDFFRTIEAGEGITISVEDDKASVSVPFTEVSFIKNKTETTDNFLKTATLTKTENTTQTFVTNVVVSNNSLVFTLEQLSRITDVSLSTTNGSAITSITVTTDKAMKYSGQ